MKKLGLLIILLLNLAILGITGFSVYEYFSDWKYKSYSSTPQEEEKENLKSTPSHLKISSIPPETKVFINGYYKGKTPVEFNVISASFNETFKLTLVRPDYAKWEKDIALKSGDSKEFRIILKKSEMD